MNLFFENFAKEWKFLNENPMPYNGRVYETKRTVELRLYPPWRTPMQDELLQTHCYRFILYALLSPVFF